MPNNASTDIYVDTTQQAFQDFISDTAAKVRSKTATLDEAVAEAAGSDFANLYRLNHGHIEYNVVSILKEAEPQMK